MIPEHKRYIEPFFGGGALYFHLQPETALINDSSRDLMSFYRQVKEQDPEMQACLYSYASGFSAMLDLVRSRITSLLEIFEQIPCDEEGAEASLSELLDLWMPEFLSLFSRSVIHNSTPVSRFVFTLSKLVPYWIIGLFVLTIAMLVARLVYGLAPLDSIGAIYFGAVLFILTISGFSLTIANFSETMQQTMFVMFFFIMVFMLLSGLLTPIDSMPEWAQRFTLILPPRYFVEILRSIYLKGATIAELWVNFAALGLFAVIFNSLAAITYRKRV